jgi:hypothetical protein
VDYTQISFALWRDIGLINGFVSPPVCHTHDGLPMSAEEDEMFEEGDDPCLHIMRLYESVEHKQAIEENHSPSVWRNPLCNP